MNFKALKIFSRVHLVVNGSIILLFVIIGGLLYYQARKNIYTETRDGFYHEIEELNSVIELYRVRDKDILSMASNFAEYKINEFSYFEESDSANIVFDAVDPISHKPMKVKIHEWFVDDMSFIENYFIVDELRKIARVDASIYQKTAWGYVNISTNIVNTNEERLLGDIILNSSEIVQSIEAGNQYRERRYKNGTWYQAIYRPLYIEGKIRGMYYVGLKERIGRALKSIFDGRKYFKEGYAFIITDKGRLSIHPKERGMDFSGTQMFKQLAKHKGKQGILNYVWPEDETGKDWYLVFKYNHLINSFVCITFPKKAVYSKLNKESFFITLWFILFFIGFQFAINYLEERVSAELRTISRFIRDIAAEGKADKVEGDSKKYKEVYRHINQISERYAELDILVKKLSDNYLKNKLPEILENDSIGKNLIKLDEKLQRALQIEREGEKEAQLRKWEADGLSKFVSILQQYTDDIEELSYNLINNLVNYLNANQGALFFLNSDNPDDVYFEQMATYAYDKKRLIKRKIYPEQGLIGRIYNEKKTIYISEIPQNYLKITSGLGELEPNYLLIVPLLMNMEVYGAIEIASFNKFEDYQIEFLEKLGENIASTINNVQINTKTRKLLEQSKQQSQKLSFQEEMMRSSIEDMEAAKKLSDIKTVELESLSKAIDKSFLLAELSPDGTIKKVNGNYLNLLGLDESDIVGRNYSIFSSMDAKSIEYRNFWNDLRAGVPVEFEEHIKIPGGAEFWLKSSYFPIKDKKAKVYKIINIAVDITRLKELEAKLKNNN